MDIYQALVYLEGLILKKKFPPVTTELSVLIGISSRKTMSSLLQELLHFLFSSFELVILANRTYFNQSHQVNDRLSSINSIYAKISQSQEVLVPIAVF